MTGRWKAASGPEETGAARTDDTELRSGISRRQALRITAVAGVSLALGGGLTRALLERTRLHRIRRGRIQMGTEVTITVVHPDAAEAQRLVDVTFDEIERLEAILSRYRPETPVSRLGREGILHAPPPELAEVLGRARDLSERTGGAFDVTVAPLLDLYRGGTPEGGGRAARGGRGGRGGGVASAVDGALPSREEIEAALALVDYRSLRVEEGVVSLERPGMSITLDGIAKGYVVDRAVATLRSGGAEQVLVEAGGDLATAAGDPGAPTAGGTRSVAPSGGRAPGWEVDVQDPHDPSGSLGVLRLLGEGVASSGDYMHAFTRDRMHHHILDPRTGRSPRHTSGVTVVAPSAMDADALSTAAFVLGPEEGLALLEGAEGVEGLIVGKGGESASTRGLGLRA